MTCIKQHHLIYVEEIQNNTIPFYKFICEYEYTERWLEKYALNF